MQVKYFLLKDETNRLITYQPEGHDSIKPLNLFYSYTYDFKWLNNNVNIISHFEFQDTDSITVFEKELKIKKNEKLHVFMLNEVKEIEMKFRYLIVPLIVGGIVLSLSLLAFFSSIVERWTGIMLVMIGIILLYFGIKGAHQVSIETFNNKFSFFLDDEDLDLKNFLLRLDSYRKNLRRFK